MRLRLVKDPSRHLSCKSKYLRLMRYSQKHPIMSIASFFATLL